jgi:ferredoxin
MEKGVPLKKKVRVYHRKCIGCMACSNACPDSVITLTDLAGQRVLRFGYWCGRQECTRCREVCPEGIISLGPELDEIRNGSTVVFLDLAYCKGCGAAFTSQRLLDKLTAELPPLLKSKPTVMTWLRLCPKCRRHKEAEGVSRSRTWRISRNNSFAAQKTSLTSFE